MSKKPKKKPRQAGAKAVQKPEVKRRDMLKIARNGVVGVVAAGGAGFWAMGSYKAYAQEHDLSRLGKGAPVIVQVHDPQCPTCTALQKQTRSALRAFDDCGLLYLVADINTTEGASLAARHGVPHVTLLFFDGQGALLRTVQGMHSSDQLASMIADHKVATQA